MAVCIDVIFNLILKMSNDLVGNRRYYRPSMLFKMQNIEFFMVSKYHFKCAPLNCEFEIMSFASHDTLIFALVFESVRFEIFICETNYFKWWAVTWLMFCYDHVMFHHVHSIQISRIYETFVLKYFTCKLLM